VKSIWHTPLSAQTAGDEEGDQDRCRRYDSRHTVSPTLTCCPLFRDPQLLRRIEVKGGARIANLVGTGAMTVIEQRPGAVIAAQPKNVVVVVDGQNGRRTGVAAPTRDARDARRPAPVVVQRTQVVRNDAVLVARQDEQR